MRKFHSFRRLRFRETSRSYLILSYLEIISKAVEEIALFDKCQRVGRIRGDER